MVCSIYKPISAILNGWRTTKLARLFSQITRKSRVNPDLNLKIKSIRNTSYSHKASLGQIGMWLAQTSTQTPSSYHLLYCIKLNGSLNTSSLNSAITTVINRHDALRSTFHWNGSELIVNVATKTIIKIAPEALHHDTINSIDLISQRFGATEYNLTDGPLYRFKLLKINPVEHLLLCGFHHLIIDGTSIKLFVSELLEAMTDPIKSRVDTQYIDFCEWQQKQVRSKNWDQALNYWQKLFKNSHATLHLPADKTRPSLPDDSGNSYHHKLPDSLSDSLKSTSAQSGISPFRLSFAAFFVFLNLISKHDNLMVATTLVGRSDPRFKRLIGLFVNTAIIKINFDKDISFSSLVQLLSSQLDTAIDIQDYPYYLTYKNVSYKHELGSDIFTPASFTKLPSMNQYNVPGLNVSDKQCQLDYATRDLSVYMQNISGEFEITWNFRTKVFSKSCIENFSKQFEFILNELLKHPEIPLKNLSYIPLADREKIFIEWNNNDQDFPNLKSLSKLVEEQTERTPNTIAVATPDLKITYRELNNYANHVALSLHARGVGTGCYIPILIKSSPELLIAELAIMKCGAAFTPIDPDWPKNRINTILEKLNSPIVFISEPTNAQHIDVKYETYSINYKKNIKPVPNLNIKIAIDNPIYCIFTSGTTGTPKGAINHQRGILNRLHSMDATFGPATNDAILATAPATVDTHIWQYFWPLISGGKTVIDSRENLIIPEKIINILEKNAITFTDFVPTIFQLLVKYLELHPESSSSLKELKHILIGGEEISSEAVYKFKTLFPAINIINSYGPTETSIGVIFQHVPNEPINPIPIGTPLPNIKTVILDENLNLVPIGISGELCIGGVCVGLGYLNDPETTKLKFIKNPFTELSCPILYRTGDLARYNTDGVIEYLGRIDNQIKIRGIRIEPEEIESVLKRHHQIDEAVVRLKKNNHNDKYLLAYITTNKNHNALNEPDLYQFLRRELPSHMIPSRFIILDHMPLSGNGKIDRSALDKQSGHTIKLEKEFKVPINELELKIVNSWKKLLNQTQIGTDDDFFHDLGGDSLSAILFVGSFAKNEQIEIDIRSLYEFPTVAKLAQHLNGTILSRNLELPANATDKIQNTTNENIEHILTLQRNYLKSWKNNRLSPDSFLFLLNRSGTAPPLFWCFQGYQEFSELAKHLGPNQPLIGMRSGHLIMEYTKANIEALASAYASEMINLQPSGNFIIGGNCQGGVIAQAIANCLEQSGRSIKRLILMEQNSFKSYQGDVALIFGRSSKFNLYLHHKNPEVFLKNFYPNLTIDLINGAHGEFFNNDNILSLAGTLKNKILSR